MGRTFGIEIEYASNAENVIAHLCDAGWANDNNLHRYHCECEGCDAYEGGVWRGQHDSTVNGELISRIQDTYLMGETLEAIRQLCDAALQVDATTSTSTGMHVHVSREGLSADETNEVALAYFLTERYFSEIVAPGASRSKREMNVTLTQAARSYVAQWRTWEQFIAGAEDVGRVRVGQILRAAIEQDRHVDLALSRRLPTWEFRVFNSTLAAWRIELAVRMATSFVDAAHDIVSHVETAIFDDPRGMLGQLGMAMNSTDRNITTKRPPITMGDFVDILAEHDPEVRPLIERQRDFMFRRYGKDVPTPGRAEI